MRDEWEKKKERVVQILIHFLKMVEDMAILCQKFRKLNENNKFLDYNLPKLTQKKLKI